MTKQSENPFRYGPPVRGASFINREVELRAVFNRMRTGQSTAIVGEPHIGKTSFLFRLTDEQMQATYIGKAESDRIKIVYLDLHSIPTNYSPRQFWEEVLEPLSEKPGSKTIGRATELARQNQFSRRSLEKIFYAMGNAERKLVLLLDEFERLLKHENFLDPSFFALLRSLSNNTGGLVLIPASRMTVAEMNDMGRGLLDIGSPFFNHMIPETLRPFDEENTKVLLGLAGEGYFTKEYPFILKMTGGHPFLLQALADTLVEIKGENRALDAGEKFYEKISSHFDDLWDAMDNDTRTAAVILSLLELGGRVLGKDFNYGEIERIDRFGPEMRKLADRGLAIRTEISNNKLIWDSDHFLFWAGEKWGISSQAFVWWVRDVVITESRKVPKYDEWLRDQHYLGLLTQKQWDEINRQIRRAPSWAIQGVGGLARALWNGLVQQEKK